MPKINTPPEMLNKENISTLPAKDKNEYINNFLKKLLEMNSEGITTSQIVDSTGYTYSTIWHHLEILSCTGQCLKKQKGNVDIFYPHIMKKHIGSLDDGLGGQFSVELVDTINGKVVSIQKNDNSTVVSGTTIPLDKLNLLISLVSSHLNNASESSGS